MRSPVITRTVSPIRLTLLSAMLFLTCTSVAAQKPGVRALQTDRLPPNVVAQYEWPSESSGVLTGSYAVPSFRSTTGDQFKFGYILTIGAWGLSKDYGTTIDWEFAVDGPLRFEYHVPFSVRFQFPREVHPGQRIFLRPVFYWGGRNPESGTRPAAPTMQATQDYSFSHKTTVWADAPDGLDATRTSFTQEARKARIYVEVPVLPIMDALSGTFDCTFSPCNEGGGSYGGSYTKLGGTGQLANTSSYSFEESDTTISLYTTGTKKRLWRQGHEQFELTATVLNLIPTAPTEAAGAGIHAVRKIGGLRLKTQLDGDLQRTDIIRLEVLRQPYVDVPADLDGDIWRFEFPIKVAYRVKFESHFTYPLGFSVVFNMKAIDPVTLAESDLLFAAGDSFESDWIEKEGEFLIKGGVPVGPPPSIKPGIAEARAPSLVARRKLVSSPALSAIRIAKPQHTRNLVRRKEMPDFQAVTAPRPGRFTVVVGRYPESQAQAVMADLASKRVGAMLLPALDSTDRIVSCGSFADEKDATLMSDMLKEMLDIATIITTDPYTYRSEMAPLGPPNRSRRF